MKTRAEDATLVSGPKHDVDSVSHQTGPVELLQLKIYFYKAVTGTLRCSIFRSFKVQLLARRSQRGGNVSWFSSVSSEQYLRSCYDHFLQYFSDSLPTNHPTIRQSELLAASINEPQKINELMPPNNNTKDTVYTSQRTLRVSHKDQPLNAVKEVIAVCYKRHTKS